VALASYIEKFVRSRAVRLLLAAALIAVSLWAFSPYLTSRIASSAFVNAELMRVNAPIAGRLTNALPRKGDFIAAPESVNLIQTLHADHRQLLDMQSKLAIAKDRADLARRQLKEIKAADDELRARAEKYRVGIIDRVGREIDEANAEKKGCLLEAQQRGDVGSRMEELSKLGSQSHIRTAEALATREATLTRCGMAEAKGKRLSVELAAAQNGTFLRDGTNDVPYSQQQRDRLFIRKQELETELFQESAKSKQLSAAIAEEQQRLNRVGKFDLSLPADHVVWSRSASPGSTVVEGQSLLDLADCRHRFLVVELPEREFERINPGDKAAVRLIGGDTWAYGNVMQVRGSAARIDDRLFAAQVLKPAAGAFSVEVALPDDTTLGFQTDYCGIGRLAEVRFARTTFGLSGAITQWWDKLRGSQNTAEVVDK
jgi:multidrug resistance efflux pump